MEYVITAGSSYLPSSLVSYAHHILLRLDGELAGTLPRAHETVRFATLADADRLAGHGDLTRATVERRLGRGDRCVLVLEEGCVLASAWGATGTRDLVALGKTFAIPEDAIYVYDTYTEPSARRRGLASSCYRYLFEQGAEAGRPVAYAAVEVLNRASLTFHARSGFRPVGRTRRLSVGVLRLTLVPRWPRRERTLDVSARWRSSGHRPA